MVDCHTSHSLLLTSFSPEQSGGQRGGEGRGLVSNSVSSWCTPAGAGQPLSIFHSPILAAWSKHFACFFQGPALHEFPPLTLLTSFWRITVLQRDRKKMNYPFISSLLQVKIHPTVWNMSYYVRPANSLQYNVVSGILSLHQDTKD